MRRVIKQFFAAFAAAIVIFMPIVPVTAGATGSGDSLMSLGDGNAVPNQSSYGYGDISTDGRYVAFNSTATNLVSNFTPQGNQVFVHDRTDGSTRLVSENNAGVSANQAAQNPIMDSTGRYVVYGSNASNLGDNNTNNFSRCYLRDLQQSTTEGATPYSTSASCFGISIDGNFIGFTGDLTGSWPGYFCPHFPCNWTSISSFIRNRTTGNITPVAIDSNGQYGFVNSSGVWENFQAERASMSDDGNIVAFWSSSPLVPGVEAGFHIYVRNMTTNSIQLIPSPNGIAGTQNNGAVVSGNGQFILYTTLQPDLQAYDVYVRNLQTGTDTQVDLDSSGNPLSGSANDAAISPDGKYVAFSHSPNGGGGQGSGTHEYIRDMQSGVTTQADITPSGQQPNNASFGPINFTQDGQLLFGSFATDLTSDNAPAPQVYLSAPLTPAAPTNLTAPTPTQTPSLSWDAVSGATSYNIYRNGTEIDSSTTNSYTDTTATPGTYDYYVTAVNSGGESSPSNTVTVMVGTAPAITSANTASTGMRTPFSFTVTTTGNPTTSLSETGDLPSGITFTDNGDGTATIAGEAPAGSDGDYPITIDASEWHQP